MQKIKNPTCTQQRWSHILKRKENKINIITTGEYRHQENIKYKTNPDHQIIKVCNYRYESASNVT